MSEQHGQLNEARGAPGAGKLARRVRECGPGKRTGRKAGTAPWADFHHRLFSFISMNWRGRPLTDYQVVVETIAATTTETGLTVAAVLDTSTYPTGVRISDAQMKAVPVQRYAFHGEWVRHEAWRDRAEVRDQRCWTVAAA
jgi:hypothetical protein